VVLCVSYANLGLNEATFGGRDCSHKKGIGHLLGRGKKKKKIVQRGYAHPEGEHMKKAKSSNQILAPRFLGGASDILAEEIRICRIKMIIDL